jgi:hypothetical protein
MPLRNFDVKIRYAYVRLKRKIAVYFTLWFLALLAGVSLVIDGIFITQNAAPLRWWDAAIVIMLAMKLAYDTGIKMKKEYTTFREENKKIDLDAPLPPKAVM